MTEITFVGFPKIHRLNREVVVTEKLDGTNALVHIDDDGTIRAGSRTRWITPLDDNYGFAAWVEANKDDLSKLGPGAHFGEWWGGKIQRGYGVKERRFSLFNTTLWNDDSVRPACCHVVPSLASSSDIRECVEAALTLLRQTGSVAAPGFASPEGVVAYHVASGTLFKVLLDKDDQSKGALP